MRRSLCSALQGELQLPHRLKEEVEEGGGRHLGTPAVKRVE